MDDVTGAIHDRNACRPEGAGASDEIVHHRLVDAQHILDGTRIDILDHFVCGGGAFDLVNLSLGRKHAPAVEYRSHLFFGKGIALNRLLNRYDLRKSFWIQLSGPTTPWSISRQIAVTATHASRTPRKFATMNFFLSSPSRYAPNAPV